MHLLIRLYTLSMYIRKRRSQFSWCEDRKSGWCTKRYANFFANDNNLAFSIENRGCQYSMRSFRYTLVPLLKKPPS